MVLRLIGVILIIAGCGGLGFSMAAAHRQEVRALRQLVHILDFMECELQNRRTPLPQLCRLVAKEFPKLPGMVFQEFAIEMETQVVPELSLCMAKTLKKFRDLTPVTCRHLQSLGKSVGRFDLEGQVKGFTAIRMDCLRELTALEDNKDARLRSYQTLGLCAGAALAILLI